MAIKENGKLTLTEISDEFGGIKPLHISSYYRGGGKVPDTPKNESISKSGRIAYSMFYGAAAKLPPEELIRLIYETSPRFSRYGSIGFNTDFTHGSRPTVWYWHGQKTNIGPTVSTYTFTNSDLAEMDEYSSICFSESFRPNTTYVSSIIDVDGNEVEFTEVYRKAIKRDYGADINDQAFTIYHAKIDRSKIKAIVTRGGYHRYRNSKQETLLVLPGKYGVVRSFESGNGNQDFTINVGEIWNIVTDAFKDSYSFTQAIPFEYRSAGSARYEQFSYTDLLFGVEQAQVQYRLGSPSKYVTSGICLKEMS